MPERSPFLKGLALKELQLEHVFLTFPIMLSRASYKASYLGTASMGGRLVYSMMFETQDGGVLGVDAAAAQKQKPFHPAFECLVNYVGCDH